VTLGSSLSESLSTFSACDTRQYIDGVKLRYAGILTSCHDVGSLRGVVVGGW
jgi:hypothetical protein